jgi:hypothetical protein
VHVAEIEVFIPKSACFCLSPFVAAYLPSVHIYIRLRCCHYHVSETQTGVFWYFSCTGTRIFPSKDSSCRLILRPQSLDSVWSREELRGFRLLFSLFLVVSLYPCQRVAGPRASAFESQHLKHGKYGRRHRCSRR